MTTDLAELSQLAQLHQVEPGDVRDPLLGFGLHSIQIQGGTSLDERLELLHPDLALVQLHLTGQEGGVQELVHLIQASGSVAEHLKRQVLNDVVDALAGDGGLLGVVHGQVEQLQELLQGGLVHTVDHAHLHNHKVQDTASVGY